LSHSYHLTALLLPASPPPLPTDKQPFFFWYFVKIVFLCLLVYINEGAFTCKISYGAEFLKAEMWV